MKKSSVKATTRTARNQAEVFQVATAAYSGTDNMSKLIEAMAKVEDERAAPPMKGIAIEPVDEANPYRQFREAFFNLRKGQRVPSKKSDILSRMKVVLEINKEVGALLDIDAVSFFDTLSPARQHMVLGGLVAGHLKTRLVRHARTRSSEITASKEHRPLQSERESSLPRFPDHLPQIDELVRTSKDDGEIDVHVDAIDYGSFRDFLKHRELLDGLIERARAGVLVRVLISTHVEPMSAANKFRDPNARKGADFEVCLGQFLADLKHYTSLAATREYEEVVRILPHANWAGDDIQTLLLLQMKLHDLELAKCLAAGIEVRATDPETELRLFNTDGEVEPGHALYWIVDRARAIFVPTTWGTDAPAYREDRKDVLLPTLNNFVSRFRRAAVLRSGSPKPESR